MTFTVLSRGALAVSYLAAAVAMAAVWNQSGTKGRWSQFHLYAAAMCLMWSVWWGSLTISDVSHSPWSIVNRGLHFPMAWYFLSYAWVKLRR